jgi:KDO2-lipid IV(A) lauroyltransferase
MLSFRTPITILYLPPKNPLFAWILQTARQGYIKQCLIQSDMRGLLRNLKGNNVVCYTPDQDKGRNSSVFAPFFGIITATVKTTGKLLSHTQAAAISVLYIRDELHKKYTLTFSPIIQDFPTGNELQDAIIMNTLLENMICQHPEQYIWQHRRFKTRPIGEPSVY